MIPIRRFSAHLAAVSALAAGFAFGADPGVGAEEPALAAVKCKRAYVNGLRVCLRVGQRCSAREKADYLFAGFVCRKRGRFFVLARAGAATLRRGRYIALPPSGRPTFNQALQMFDAAFGLPGVSRQPGVVGASFEGTTAIESLARYRSRLTGAQRAVFDRVVRPPGARAQASQAGLPPLVQEAKTRLEAKGLRFPHPVAVAAHPPGTPVPADGRALAYTVTEWLYGAGQRCVVYLPPVFNSLGVLQQRATAAHELMHCAVGELLVPGQDLLPVMWVREGLPEWGGATIAFEWSGAIGPVATRWWSSYLRNGELELMTRSYDAVGFYALLQHEGVDVWSRIPTIVRASGSGNPLAAYLGAVSGAPGGVFDNWGTTLAIRPSLGAPWDLAGPGMPRPPGLPASYPLGNGASFGAPVAARGGYAARLGISADVVRVSAPGSTRGRLKPAQGAEVPVAGRKAFCAKPGGCKCKNGRDLGLPTIGRGTAYIGYSGPGASALRVAGESLAQACDEPAEEEEEGQPGPVGSCSRTRVPPRRRPLRQPFAAPPSLISAVSAATAHDRIEHGRGIGGVNLGMLRGSVDGTLGRPQIVSAELELPVYVAGYTDEGLGLYYRYCSAGGRPDRVKDGFDKVVGVETDSPRYKGTPGPGQPYPSGDCILVRADRRAYEQSGGPAPRAVWCRYAPASGGLSILPMELAPTRAEQRIRTVRIVEPQLGEIMWRAEAREQAD